MVRKMKQQTPKDESPQKARPLDSTPIAPFTPAEPQSNPQDKSFLRKYGRRIITFTAVATLALTIGYAKGCLKKVEDYTDKKAAEIAYSLNERTNERKNALEDSLDTLTEVNARDKELRERADRDNLWQYLLLALSSQNIRTLEQYNLFLEGRNEELSKNSSSELTALRRDTTDYRKNIRDLRRQNTVLATLEHLTNLRLYGAISIANASAAAVIIQSEKIKSLEAREVGYQNRLRENTTLQQQNVQLIADTTNLAAANRSLQRRNTILGVYIHNSDSRLLQARTLASNASASAKRYWFDLSARNIELEALRVDTSRYRTALRRARTATNASLTVKTYQDSINTLNQRINSMARREAEETARRKAEEIRARENRTRLQQSRQNRIVAPARRTPSRQQPHTPQRELTEEEALRDLERIGKNK